MYLCSPYDIRLLYIIFTGYVRASYALQTSRIIIIIYNIVTLLHFNGCCELSHYYDASYRYNNNNILSNNITKMALYRINIITGTGIYRV